MCDYSNVYVAILASINFFSLLQFFFHQTNKNINLQTSSMCICTCDKLYKTRNESCTLSSHFIIWTGLLYNIIESISSNHLTHKIISQGATTSGRSANTVSTCSNSCRHISCLEMSQMTPIT